MRPGINSPPTSSFRVAALFVGRWVETAVSEALEADGMKVSKFRTSAELMTSVQNSDVDMILIEDHGGHLAGCLATMRFRGVTTVPIIAVGNGSAAEIAAALRLGAADYAVMGQATHTLVSRIRARIDVCQQRDQRASLQFGACTLDAQSRSLLHGHVELQLTWREFALAWVLFESAGQVVHLQTLSRQVWGTDISVAKRTIEQHVSRLRRKLLLASETTEHRLVLHAVTNVGYRLVVEGRPARRVQDVPRPPVLTEMLGMTAVEP